MGSVGLLEAVVSLLFLVNGGVDAMEMEDTTGHAARPGPGTATGTGLVYHEDYLRHSNGPGHPERPQRLTAIVAHLERVGLRRKLVAIEPRSAEVEWITRIHSEAYVNGVEAVCRSGGGLLDFGDTGSTVDSYRVARLAAGGVLAAVDGVVAGRVQNAFCLVRPPGHHATRGGAKGFCIFNNVAIAARYAQEKHGIERVLIVDWDVHHGNGTQDAFYDDPTVFYFSIHRFPYYPGSGSARERGRGKGEGFTLNVPLSVGSGRKEYLEAFRERLLPAASRFKPGMVLVSAGFDAYVRDPLGGMELGAEEYAELARIVCAIAETEASGRLVAVLEGGYDLEGLSTSVEAVLRVLLELRGVKPGDAGRNASK